MDSEDYVVVEFIQEKAVDVVHKSWIKITKKVSFVLCKATCELVFDCAPSLGVYYFCR